MRRVAPALLPALLLLPGCGAGLEEGAFPSGPLGIAVEVQPREVPLGAPATLRVRWRRGPGVEATFPDLKPALADFTTGPAGEPRRTELADGTLLEERTWQLRCFEAGTFTIPAVEALGRKDGGEITAKSGPVELAVTSVLAAGQEKEIEKPEKAAELPRPPFWPWLAGAGVLLVLLVLLLGRLLRRRRRRLAQPPPPPAAHLEALAALERLRREPREEAVAVERMVERAAAVIRRYVERRFGLRAPERTTEEFLQEAAAPGGIPEAEREGLAAFLFDCDKAKFARWTPGPARQGELLDSAEAFVRRTAPAGEGAA